MLLFCVICFVVVDSSAFVVCECGVCALAPSYMLGGVESAFIWISLPAVFFVIRKPVVSCLFLSLFRNILLILFRIGITAYRLVKFVLHCSYILLRNTITRLGLKPHLRSACG